MSVPRIAEDPALLAAFQAPAFRDRIARSLAIIAAALEGSRRPYVAFSGGKDSLVVGAMAEAIRPDITYIWSDDELEYPEQPGYMEELRERSDGHMLVTLGWSEHAGWFRPWSRRPYWRQPLPDTLRIGRDMDRWAWQQGYDLVILGTRMAESSKRRAWLLQSGPTYDVSGGVRRCCPIGDWSTDDVWTLIAGWGLPYSPVYDGMEAAGIPRGACRVGPLPLAPRRWLDLAYPTLLQMLEQRYQRRWSE